jgi:hypothetical protein
MILSVLNKFRQPPEWILNSRILRPLNRVIYIWSHWLDQPLALAASLRNIMNSCHTDTAVLLGRLLCIQSRRRSLKSYIFVGKLPRTYISGLFQLTKHSFILPL